MHRFPTFDSSLRGFALGLLLLGACDRFDPQLYKDRLAAEKDGGAKDAGESDGGGGGGGKDAGGKDGGGGDDKDAMVAHDSGTDSGAPQILVPTDRCDTQKPPVVTGSLSMLTIDTKGMDNDFATFSSCSGHNAPGNDAFFSIDVEAGEKWHFHVIDQGDAKAPSNPVVYLLPSCDARTCQPRNALDLCGNGTDEHFTFVASEPGHWFLGLDDRIAGAHEYQVVALRTTCGDNQLEHGEACDDGDRDLAGAGDECDSQCRTVIPDKVNAVEREPNDDWTVANSLQLPDNGPIADRSMKVKGAIGGLCDYDMFAISVPKNWGVEVDLRNTNGTVCGKVPCQSDDSEAYCFCDADAGVTECDFPTQLRLELLDGDGALVLASGAPNGATDCPVIEATEGNSHDLEEGLYFVRLWGNEADPEFRYEINITVAAP